MPDHNYFANLIWQIADLLRGPYRPPQYERVMLPMTVLRRFDCVLAPTKARVLAEYDRWSEKLRDEALDAKLNQAAGQRFHNHSPLDFEKLKGDPDHIAQHLVSYIKGFSSGVRRIFEYFEFENEIEKMREANILYLVVSKFCDVDLHPDRVPNAQMGLIFENLIRRFNELANETAGDHFTHWEVIRLMVSILFINDDQLLATPGVVRKLLDPACGTGGMLAEAQNYLREHHQEARLFVYGQDYNKRAFATAASDMLMKQVDHNGGEDNIRFGDSFTDDRFASDTFDYFLTNPPFGADWKKQQKEIKREHEKLGFAGRFGPGLPRVNDGSLLFLLHMLAKFERVDPSEHKHGSRLAIVFSGSPLFSGGAGSGESNIRKWIIENDWLEAIIALPEQMFYNTGIGTYVWIVTNHNEKRRKGKIQLLDARGFWTAGGSAESKRSLGDKRRHISASQIEEIVRLYGRFENGEHSKIFDNADFGYTRITVERPLRLRYQMTTEDKARFLDVCPHLLDDVLAIDKALGREPKMDWNRTWNEISGLLHERKAKWKKTEQKLFRDVFTQKDPDVPLRDSGIPWLGAIPAHWQTERARWLFRERDQRSQTGEEELLTVSHITGVTSRSEKEVNMFEAETKEGYKICHIGDLVINTMWAWMGAMGVSPLHGIVSPGYNVYEPIGKLDSTYVDFLVRLPIFAQEVTRYSKGVWSSRLRLYPEGFFEVYFPVPPLEEQAEIVDAIGVETNKIYSLSTATQQTINLLKERRAALIAAAVTGQIDLGGDL